MNILNHVKPLLFQVGRFAGTAIVGYLGYRVVRWLFEKCSKVNQSALPLFNAMAASENIRTKFEREEGPIKLGQGEYIVFNNASDDSKFISQETYEKVYQIFDRYSPGSIIQQTDEKEVIDELKNRYDLIHQKVKEIDSSLEIAFIPKTIYELFFIRKCIKEDLKAKEICEFLDPKKQQAIHYPEKSVFERLINRDEIFDLQTKRKCWHLGYFDDAGDNQNAKVKEVAYRLNQVMVKTFSPKKEGFTYEELSSIAEKEINFLKSYYTNCIDLERRQQNGEQVDEIGSCQTPGPTTQFGTESIRDNIKPMGIRNDQDAQIIQNALALECSKKAVDSVFIFRGSHFKDDHVLSKWAKNHPYSLSFGTSLFAGCLYDGGASAFHYMRDRDKHAYSFAIPYDKIKQSPFYVPPTNTLVQLFGDGEVFHARSKAWKEHQSQGLSGVRQGEQRTDHLHSNLTKEELIAQFEDYKKQAIHLK